LLEVVVYVISAREMDAPVRREIRIVRKMEVERIKAKYSCQITACGGSAECTTLLPTSCFQVACLIDSLSIWLARNAVRGGQAAGRFGEYAVLSRSKSHVPETVEYAIERRNCPRRILERH
jgi:hypothetical protein